MAQVWRESLKSGHPSMRLILMKETWSRGKSLLPATQGREEGTTRL